MIKSINASPSDENIIPKTLAIIKRIAYTKNEMAELLGRSLSWVNKRIALPTDNPRRLITIKIGKCRRILHEDLLSWLSRAKMAHSLVIEDSKIEMRLAFSVTEAAFSCHFSQAFLYRWMRNSVAEDQRLPFSEPTSDRLILYTDYVEWLRKHRDNFF